MRELVTRSLDGDAGFERFRDLGVSFVSHGVVVEVDLKSDLNFFEGSYSTRVLGGFLVCRVSFRSYCFKTVI